MRSKKKRKSATLVCLFYRAIKEDQQEDRSYFFFCFDIDWANEGSTTGTDLRRGKDLACYRKKINI